MLERAHAGAGALFHVVLPDFTALDVKAYYVRFTRPAVIAMQRHGVRRVVTVSAIGRGATVKAGPVTAALPRA